MTAIRINPMVVSVSPTDTTPIHRISPTQHGGGVKKVIAVVAAVAIPIAAPAIASSIVASGVLGASVSAAAATTVGAVASSAIVGAGLGAITAKVTGGDVKAGAIGGALGGAIGGYNVAQSTGAGLGNVNQTGIKATTDQVFGTNFSGNATAQPGAATTTTAEGGLQSTTGETLSSTPTADGTLVNAADDVTLQNAAYTTPAGGDVASQLSNTGAGTVTPVAATTAGGASAAATNVAAEATKASLGERFMTGMKAYGSKVVEKVTGPDALANLTVQAGAQLLGQALAPDPSMPPEQAALLQERRAELAELKERDEEAFNAQMAAAKQYLQQAQQFDPTYMAQQAANKEAIKQSRGLREQYRQAALGSGRDISAAERRRMELDAARNVSSQYDQGFQQGLTAQNKVTQAGLSAIPNASAFSTYTDALKNLSDDYGQAERLAQNSSAAAAKNITDLFAGFNTTAGNTKEQKEELEGIGGSTINKKAGLNTAGIAV